MPRPRSCICLDVQAVSNQERTELFCEEWVAVLVGVCEGRGPSFCIMVRYLQVEQKTPKCVCLNSGTDIVRIPTIDEVALSRLICRSGQIVVGRRGNDMEGFAKRDDFALLTKVSPRC